MKTIKLILPSLLLGVVSFMADAQTASHTPRHSAHSAAHQELLTNAKSRLDKDIIREMVKEVVATREQPAAASLSAESSRLIDDLLAEGRSHIGKRYVHGAKGPSALDCS